MQAKPFSHARGFSLVELSIVLVILGLLVGGILAGQSLIRAAELRAFTTTAQSYQTATYSFRDKYFQLPGDMTNATSFWGILAGDGNNATCQNTPATGAPTCNGNGNGLITDNTVTADERFRFWQHLANAGLIEGSYTGRTDSGTAGSFVLTGNVSVPAVKSVATFTPVYTSSADAALGATYYWFSTTRPANYLNFRALASGSMPLSPEEAWNIDTKTDDGKPATGSVVGPQSTWTGSPNCTTSDSPATAAYNLSNTAKICRFDIKL